LAAAQRPGGGFLRFGKNYCRRIGGCRERDALQTLSVDLPETIDLVLLDGAKAIYPEILKLVENRLKPGASRPR
jgi:predicted O-methyltransferase YrrM